MTESNFSPQSDETTELKIAIAELRGELRKTPSRMDYYGSVLGMAAIFTAVFAGLVFIVLQQEQNEFENNVREVIQDWNEEQSLKFEEFLDDMKNSEKLK